MMFVNQHEDWQLEGGVMSHVMGRLRDLVLDDHRHPHQAKPFKRKAAADAAPAQDACTA
jgi:hypothetical protein